MKISTSVPHVKDPDLLDCNELQLGSHTQHLLRREACPGLRDGHTAERQGHLASTGDLSHTDHVPMAFTSHHLPPLNTLILNSLWI